MKFAEGLRKIFWKGYYEIFDSKRTSYIDYLIKNGNLKVGTNCKIDSLKIISYKAKPANINIEIGNDCNLNCTIVLYNENAHINIGNRVFVGPDTQLIALEEIAIEDDVMISWGCTLMDNDSHSVISTERENDVIDFNKGLEFKNWDVVLRKKIRVERKSWIGFNCIILKGVEILEGSVVASGSVVTKTFRSFSIIGGNPARFIRETK